MAPSECGVQCSAPWRHRLELIGVGTPLQQQLHRPQVTTRRRATQRQSGIIGRVIRYPIDQLRALVQQLLQPLDIADSGSGADVVLSTTSKQVADEYFVLPQRLTRHVAPAA